MKNHTPYITSLYRSIAYVLLLSQLLTGCGTSVIPQPQRQHAPNASVPVLVGIPEDAPETSPRSVASARSCASRCNETAAVLEDAGELMPSATYVSWFSQRTEPLVQAHSALWHSIHQIHEPYVEEVNGDDLETSYLTKCKQGCQQPIKYLARRTGMKPMKLLLVGGILPTLLGVTSLPYWHSFQVDSTACQHPASRCTIATASFSLTTLPPRTLAEDLNASSSSLIFYRDKQRELLSAWYQQHPCAFELMKVDNASIADEEETLYEEDPARLASYLDCVQATGEQRSNTTASVLQYLATQSRENTGQDDPQLDTIVSVLRSQFNKDMQMQLAELHRLQANEMGENIKSSQAFDEATAARTKQTTTNAVSLISLTWHVVAELLSVAAVIYFFKNFVKQGSILQVEKIAGEGSTPKQLSYNTTLFNFLPLCITGAVLSLGLCAYLQERELFDSQYTLNPAATVVLDTLLLGTAFWGLYNISSPGNAHVERAFAGIALVSTAIWFPLLMNALQVDVQAPANCTQRGSFAALASKHNGLVNMLQVIASNGFTEKILEMAMPHFATQLASAAVPHAALPAWCTSNEVLAANLVTNEQLVLYLYLITIGANVGRTMCKGFTHNSFVSYSKIMWVARCIFAYDQAILHLPFIHVQRSLPLPNFLESLTMATVLASSVLVNAEDVGQQEATTSVAAEATSHTMRSAESQGAVMGAVDSMVSMASSISSVASSVESRLSVASRRVSDAFQRMLSGL